MNPVRYTVVLDVKKSGSQQKLQGFYKGENKSREIEIVLIKDSNILSVDDECTLIVYGEKGDGSTFMQSCEVVDGRLIFTPFSNAFSAVGDVECQIQIMDSDRKIMYSPSFTIEVCENVRDDKAIESTEEFAYLDEAIRKIEEIKKMTGLDGISIGRAENFKGKTLLVTGDSITEKNGRAEKNWHDYIKEWCRFDAVKNDGKSGSGLVKENGIIYRIANWDRNYGNFDMILIMGNMNDGASGTAVTDEWIGTFADKSEDMKDKSLYGALHYTLKTLIERYPNKPIGWIISTPRSQVVNGMGKCHGTDGWFENWVTVIKEVCANYSVPVLDLYHESGLRPWNAENNKEYFSCEVAPDGDGIHPNAKGQEIIAKKIYPWVLQYMDPNMTLPEIDEDDDNPGDDNTGGDNTGGDNTGGDNTGGDNTGGDNTGGDNTGGDDTGGDNTGDDLTSHDIYDTFSRADSTTLGDSDSGHEWFSLTSMASLILRYGKAIGGAYYNMSAIETGSVKIKMGATFTKGTAEGLLGNIANNSPSNFVAARVNGNTFEIVQKINEANTVLASTSVDIPTGTEYILTMEYDYTNIRAALDNGQMLEATAKQAINGTGIGIYLGGTTGKADNFYADILS